jgi:hypothetical protein
VTQVLDEGFAEFVALAGLAATISGITRQKAACLCVAISGCRDLARGRAFITALADRTTVANGVSKRS